MQRGWFCISRSAQRGVVGGTLIAKSLSCGINTNNVVCFFPEKTLDVTAAYKI